MVILGSLSSTRPARAVNAARYAAPAKANSGPDSPGDGGIIKNQSSPHAKLRSVDLQSVHWTGGFWADQFETTSAVTLPRLRALAGPWAWHNMQVAAGLKEGEAKGCYWEDAWLYKWIESACYVYTQTRDPPKLLKQMDEVIAAIANAQHPDGYLATQVTLRERPRSARTGTTSYTRWATCSPRADSPPRDRSSELPRRRPPSGGLCAQDLRRRRSDVGQLPDQPFDLSRFGVRLWDSPLEKR